MFLSLLNDQEQRAFLDLAYYVANVDGVLAKEQEVLLTAYRREMLLPSSVYETSERNIDEILSVFRDSDTRVKLAVYLEIMALIVSDGTYERSEHEAAMRIADELSISKEKHDQIFSWVNDMQNLYVKASELIDG